MRILQRYLLRELTFSFLGVSLVLLAILMVNQIGLVLARAAELQYPRGVVLELIGLGAAQNSTLVLPFSLLLGIVLAFGRLYHDSEMTAAQVCGVGVWRVALAVWVLAVPVAGLIGWVDLDLAPRAARAEVSLRNQALRAGLTAPLAPGQFRSFGRIVVYARARGAGAGDLRDLFIERNDGALVQTTTARSAHYELSADGRTELLTLYNGQQVEGIPGARRFRITRFAQQQIPIRLPRTTAPPPRRDELPTVRLLGSTQPRLQAELQWRLALPIMALVLTVLAVPMARLKPRQGRYARVWVAVLAFAVYANLVLAARTWLERGITPFAIGTWWVHGLFLLLGVLVALWPRLERRLGVRRRPPTWSPVP